MILIQVVIPQTNKNNYHSVAWAVTKVNISINAHAIQLTNLLLSPICYNQLTLQKQGNNDVWNI